MSEAARILIVDDDPVVADSLSEFLTKDGYTTATAGDGNEALLMLDTDRSVGHRDDAAQCFGLIVADMNMPRCNGLDLLRAARKRHPAVALIMITGYGKIESAVEAVKLGAADYLTKPLVDDELRIAIDKAMQQHALLAENQTLRSQLSERYGLGNLVGDDYRMQKVYDLLEAVAPSKTTVVISGESGTGKSVVARAIHTLSSRSTFPFVTFSCGAMPETLLESELFGYAKGAFTGAVADKPGRILAADGGTLFIDEINSATPALQLKLLRVLQEKQFEPVGSTDTVTVNVRFVLATNESLPKLVETGMFREDLYYRINVVNIHLPPLCQRVGDIHLLADHFLTLYCREAGKMITAFTPEALEALCRYDWPGNVRELENAIERSVVLARQPVIGLQDLPEAVLGSGGLRRRDTVGPSNGGLVIASLEGGWNPMPLAQAMQEPEKQIIIAALTANNWNRQLTAQQLNINRTTLYKKIKQYKLDQPS